MLVIICRSGRPRMWPLRWQIRSRRFLSIERRPPVDPDSSVVSVNGNRKQVRGNHSQQGGGKNQPDTRSPILICGSRDVVELTTGHAIFVMLYVNAGT